MTDTNGDLWRRLGNHSVAVITETRLTHCFVNKLLTAVKMSLNDEEIFYYNGKHNKHM